MPFIGYSRLGAIVGKTEDEVRADKAEGIIDLDDFDSLVRYVANSWGWGPLDPLEARVKDLESQLESVSAPKPSPKKDARPQLGAADLPHPTVRWKVEDRSETSDDPYLDRVKRLK